MIELAPQDEARHVYLTTSRMRAKCCICFHRLPDDFVPAEAKLVLAIRSKADRCGRSVRRLARTCWLRWSRGAPSKIGDRMSKPSSRI